MGVVINTATAATLSFLVFWLVLGSDIKEHHTSSGTVYYLAPLYLTMVLAGMAGLVFAPRIPLGKWATDEDEATRPSCVPSAEEDRMDGFVDDSKLLNDSKPAVPENKVLSFLAGLLFAIGAGVFSALQYGVVNIGKRIQETDAGCYNNSTAHPCPDYLKEEFDNFGSWMVSFAIGTAGVTLCYVVLLFGYSKAKGQEMPGLKLDVMKGPGSCAGLCWSVANFLNTAAVVQGGNAIVMAQTTAVQLVTSGAWGIFYYNEIRGWHAVIWSMFAVWTLASMMLLGFEKGT